MLTSTLVVRKISRPPGRSKRAASGIQAAGSHHRLAPYSENARSKLASGSGTGLGAGLEQREVAAKLLLTAASGLELSRRDIDADGPRAAPREPTREVRRAAAQLDYVEAAHIVEHVQGVLWNLEHAPKDLRCRPGALGAGVGVRAIGFGPQRAISCEAGCDKLYSEDMNAGQRFGSIVIVNPFK
jgi:hypothetical protein